MRNIVLLFLSFSLTMGNSVFGRGDNLKTEIVDFKSADWKTVKQSKMVLENTEKQVIPALIEMLNDDSKNKLENTGSLIYPGATRFYGHGQMLDYDIDFLAIRAGWLLEDISFNNFGFTGIHLPADLLPNHIKITFPEYYNNSSNRKKIETSSLEELQKLALKLSIDEAKTWWKKNSQTFSRLEALVEALTSYDEKRQVKALFYIRNGTTKCTGLTKDYYIEEIAKEIVRMSSSDIKRISENAILILQDSRFEWLENKNGESH